MLDNSCIMFVSEHWNAHNGQQVPLVLAGGLGGTLTDRPVARLPERRQRQAEAVQPVPVDHGPHGPGVAGIRRRQGAVGGYITLLTQPLSRGQGRESAAPSKDERVSIVLQVRNVCHRVLEPHWAVCHSVSKSRAAHPQRQPRTSSLMSGFSRSSLLGAADSRPGGLLPWTDSGNTRRTLARSVSEGKPIPRLRFGLVWRAGRSLKVLPEQDTL